MFSFSCFWNFQSFDFDFVIHMSENQISTNRFSEKQNVMWISYLKLRYMTCSCHPTSRNRRCSKHMYSTFVDFTQCLNVPFLLNLCTVQGTKIWMVPNKNICVFFPMFVWIIFSINIVGNVGGILAKRKIKQVSLLYCWSSFWGRNPKFHFATI